MTHHISIGLRGHSADAGAGKAPGIAQTVHDLRFEAEQARASLQRRPGVCGPLPELHPAAVSFGDRWGVG